MDICQANSSPAIQLFEYELFDQAFGTCVSEDKSQRPKVRGKGEKEEPVPPLSCGADFNQLRTKGRVTQIFKTISLMKCQGGLPHEFQVIDSMYAHFEQI